jgi:hypothetical protein
MLCISKKVPAFTANEFDYETAFHQGSTRRGEPKTRKSQENVLASIF